MHSLHEYVAQKLAEQVRRRRIVVWYDERKEFLPFVRESTTRAVPTRSSPPGS